MNSSAAITEFQLLAAAISGGTLDPSVDEGLQTELLEQLSEKVHDAWIEREKWRKGEASYDSLAIPYAQLPENEKEKDRSRVRAMFGQIRRDWATLTE